MPTLPDWTIKEKIKWKDYKNAEAAFPLVEDTKMDVAKKFGMMHHNQSATRQ